MVRKLTAYILIFVMVISNIMFDFTEVIAAESISFTKGGTLTHPTVNVTVNTDDKVIAGIYYERGYNQKATTDSKRIYGYENQKGTVNFSLGDVTKHVSVLVKLYDKDTGTISEVGPTSYELEGKRIFNSGGASFSIYPTTPLNDDSNMATLRGDIVDTFDYYRDNGPIMAIEDEVWIFSDNGWVNVYKSNDVKDAFFSDTDKNIEPSARFDVGVGFSEHSSSGVYDGRYIITGDGQSQTPVIIDVENRTVYKGNDVKTIITNYDGKVLYNSMSALAYDGTDIYVLIANITRVDRMLYKLISQGDGTYKRSETAIHTFNTDEMSDSPDFNDMVFDGNNLWIAGSANTIIQYNIADKKVTKHASGHGRASRIIYDGEEHVYAIGVEGRAEAGNVVHKININTGAYTTIYSDMSATNGKEDLNFDGRNLWVHTNSNYSRERYDLKSATPGKVSMTITDWNKDKEVTGVAGVYDGRWEWFTPHKNNKQLVGVVGHISHLNYGADATNLEKVFLDDAGNIVTGVADDVEIYVDDDAATSPDYVGAKISAGKSTSDIIYAAWGFGSTAKDEAFFNDISNFDSDTDFTTSDYENKRDKYFVLDTAELPTVTNGEFNFTFTTYPKTNGEYTLYMINEQGDTYLETIKVENYVTLGKLYIQFIEEGTDELIHETIDGSRPQGNTTVSAELYVEDMLERGYTLDPSATASINLGPSGVIKFYVKKDKTRWAEVIKRPYYMDGATKKYLSEVNDGLYLLTDKSVTDSDDYEKITVDAPHIDTYLIKDLSKSSVSVALPPTIKSPDVPATATSFGKIYVEFEYVANDKIVLITGIEVDDKNKPTGNLVYTEQLSGQTGKTGTAKATTDTEILANWEFVGLANYDTSGDFVDLTTGTGSNEKTVTFGTDTDVKFAYKRKLVDVEVKYYDKTDPNNIVEIKDDSDNVLKDTFKVPVNTDFTATARAIDKYKLASGQAYTETKTVTGATTISFYYVGIDEAVIIEAVIKDTDGKVTEVLMRDSKEAPLGSSLTVTSTDFDTKLNNRYKLVGSKTQSVTVKDGTLVQFVYEEQISKITVKYVYSDGSAITGVSNKTYDVPYDTVVKESAISIKDHYVDTTDTATKTYTAADATKEIIFKYKKSEGSITVFAKDVDTGNYLTYKVYTGGIGEGKEIDPAKEFERDSALKNYNLVPSTDKQTVKYSATNTTLVLNYKRPEYTITITGTGTDTDGNTVSVNFYDGTEDGKASKVFTYKKGDNYSIYAPNVEGYEVVSKNPYFTGTDIQSNLTHKFEYKQVNTDVNMTVKFVSSDESEIIKTIVVTGTRDEEHDFKASDYLDNTDATDKAILEKWELIDTGIKKATYGNVGEVIFKFKRKEVELTVLHKDKTTGTVLYTDKDNVYTKSTNKILNALDKAELKNYELAENEDILKNVVVGTVDLTVTFLYDKSVGNVIVIAKDENDNILEKRSFTATQGSTFEVTDSTLSKFVLNTDTTYEYKSGKGSKLVVDSNSINNILYVVYKKVPIKVTVKYLNEDDDAISLAREHTLHKGSSIEVNAINIDNYNFDKVTVSPTSATAITINGSNVAISPVNQAYTVTYKYKMAEFTPLTKGVINVISKDTAGNILNIVTHVDLIGAELKVKGDTITGYTLQTTEEQTVKYIHGSKDVIITYQVKNLKVTVEAKNKDIDKAIPFEGTKSYDVQEGKDITVYAPHIPGYVVVGDNSKTFTNVLEAKTATFEYTQDGEIIVLKGIEVDSSNVATGNTVYTEVKSGYELGTTTLDAKTLENYTLKGLVEYDKDGKMSVDSDKTSQDVTFGTDTEVVFAYERKQSKITIQYLEDKTDAVVSKEEIFTVPLNTNFTTNAKAIEEYELLDPDNFNLSFTADSAEMTKKFVYKKLDGTVILEARLDSATGTVLAQSSVDVPIGTEKHEVTASDLVTMLSPRYKLETATKQTIDKVEQGSKVTYVFSEQTSKVTVKYVDEDGKSIATKTPYDVPYGTTITETAKSVRDYYLDTSKPDNTANRTDVASKDTYEYTFTYKQGNGAITIIAKDGATDEILYYETREGVIGNSLEIDSTTLFAGEDFYDYYNLDTATSTAKQTLKYTNAHQEMIFVYDEETYKVIISAEDVDSDESLNFSNEVKLKEFEYRNGETYLIYAPSVTGYTLAVGEDAYIEDKTGISKDITHTFKYKKVELQTNLTVKAVSDDDDTLIGAKILSGKREEAVTVDINDYEGDIFSSDEWELVGDKTQSTKFGDVDKLIFKFKRKEVNVTVKFVDENDNPITGTYVGEDGKKVTGLTTENLKHPTNTPFTAIAKVIDGYVLAENQKQTISKNIGTSDDTITIKYVKADGNVIIEAVDEDGKILDREYVKQSEGTSYTVDSSVITKFDTSLVGYTRDTSNSNNKLTIDSVNSDTSKNIAKVVYKKQLAKIVVRYVDENDNDIASANTVDAQFGHALTVYAKNIDLYNLVDSAESMVTITNVSEDKEIKFVYYSISTGGVINVMAKTTDNKVLDVRSFTGKIGSSQTFDPNILFGTITGYTLQSGTKPKTATYTDGFVNVEFIYETSDLNVTIEAKDVDGNKLTFTEPNVVSTKEGETVTVYAPHIADHEVAGYEISNGTTGTKSFAKIDNITKNETVTFKYNKISVPSVIYIKHLSRVGSQIIELYTELKKGNIGDIVIAKPLDPSTLNGYNIDPIDNVEKKVKHGDTEKVEFYYNRTINKLELIYNVRIFDGLHNYNSGNVYHTVSESEKKDDTGNYYMPQLYNEAINLEVDSKYTIPIPFADDYVIDLKEHGGVYPDLRETVTMSNSVKREYNYRNILGNVLIRAVVEDEAGNIELDGKRYTIIAQMDDNAAIGAPYVNANVINADLEDIVAPQYKFEKLLYGEEKFTPEAGDTYKDHIVTYLYTGNYKNISVSYVDEDGEYINHTLLGIESNPRVVKVLSGTAYSKYAISVQNYEFEEYNTVFASPKPKAAMPREVFVDNHATGTANSDGEIKFVYKKLNDGTVMVLNGTGLADIPAKVILGQRLYAPYVDGYEPSPLYYDITGSIKPRYEFDYTKIKSTGSSTVDTIIEYKDKVVYEKEYVTDYVGSAEPFVHEPFIQGYDDGTVRPDGAITRSEVVSILYNILYDENIPSTKNITFTDVPKDAWYTEKLYYLAGLNYIYGYEDGTFRADAEITRQEISAIMSRIFGKGYEGEIDGLSIEDYWAKDSIIDSYGSGFYDDINVTNYDWKQLATRAEVVVMMNNALNRVPNHEFLNTVNVPVDLLDSHWAYYHMLEALTLHTGHYEGNFGDEREIIREFDYKD